MLLKKNQNQYEAGLYIYICDCDILPLWLTNSSNDLQEDTSI